MHAVQIPDPLFIEAQRAALANGMSLEEFVADAVQLHLPDPENFDHRFTPEVIAHLDRIAADIDSGGKTYSPLEVDEMLLATKKAWLANHQS